jgi:isoleucyl-tRNA synthetase
MVQDPAVIVTFPLLEDPTTCLLAWTTTPWTLPSHTGLAVNANFEYVKIYDEKADMNYVLLESLIGTLYKKPKDEKYKVVARYKGSEMLGWRYQPLFSYFYDQFKDYGFRVFNDDYVTSTSGVGIVHQAPAFGEEDFNVAMKHGVISPERLPPNPVDDNGRFTSEVTHFAGQHVKEADKAIIKHLQGVGRLIVHSQISHSYPLCPRSDTPLIYRAVSSWFIKIPPVVPKMLENIEQIHWVPEFVKKSRFANWIVNARDWAVSRNRYWGTPIPLWVSDDYEEVICIESAEELKALSGYDGNIDDLHRHKIDHITIPSRRGKGNLRRIEEVFDCWFESGSMPYASQHYPFENADGFEERFPADFIAEGLDQTRGWFYTLVVLGTYLFDVSPFKNCVTNGMVLAEDGKKMSKRLQNYPSPDIIMDKYGSDALRLYLINSPVVRAELLKFKESGVREVVQKVLLPLWNSYKFFEGQVVLLHKMHNVSFVFNPKSETDNENIMDKWILASCQSLLKFVNAEMAGRPTDIEYPTMGCWLIIVLAYRLYTVVPRLLDLIGNTTNWYIRFNRQRLKGEQDVQDTIRALNTLFETLYTLVRGLAPFIPFLTDKMYLLLLHYMPPELQNPPPHSVHFLPFPELREELFDETVERRVTNMQKVIELGRVTREREPQVTLKQPLKTLIVIHSSPEFLEDIKCLEVYIKDELNVHSLVLSSDESKYDVRYSVAADWTVLGKKFKRDAPKLAKALPKLTDEQVKQFISDGFIEIEGLRLDASDLRVKREIPSSNSNRLAVNTDDHVLIILDKEIYPELAEVGLGREIINRIQRLRKKAGLTATDDVRMEYADIKDPENIGVEKAFESQTEAFRKVLRRDVHRHDPTAARGKDDGELIMEEQQELQSAVFMLKLLKL